MMETGRRDVIKLAACAALPWVGGAAGRWTAADAAVLEGPVATLAAAFAQPPQDARPGIFWYWLGDNVTAEGIRADVAAMHDAGIGVIALFSIGGLGLERIVDPSVPSLTPDWWSLIALAVAEAGRLGMQVLMNACDGWATAGGPWITPELSMQKLVWTETVAAGGRLPVQLPSPETNAGYYRDLRVVAFPRPDEWDRSSTTLRPVIGGTLAVENAAMLLDPTNDRVTVRSDRAGTLEFSFADQFLLRSVTVRTPKPVPPSGGPPPPQPVRAAHSMTITASDDGIRWQDVGALEFPRHGWQTPLEVLTHAVPETRARHFRFTYTPETLTHFREDMQLGQLPQLALASMILSARPAIHHLPIKSAQTWGHARRMTAADLPRESCVASGTILDLTTALRSDGTLDWRPPGRGRWTVLRIGATTTGTDNHPVTKNGHGLECDKLNTAAANVQFDGWFQKALERVGPALAGKVLHVFHVDSWEAKSQNWSPALAAEFARRRGYDILAALPILAGIPVDTPERCERVLFDVRRTIAECVTDNFYAPLRARCDANGCLFSGEVSNPTMPTDGLDYGQSLDMPMGEFWHRTPQNHKPSDIKEAVSASRIYGRRIAGAEAFTNFSIRWDETPWTLKALGDHHYAEGINRFFLHVYAHQPWLDRRPGMTLSGIGTFFGRTQTWWKPGKAWIDYLARSQALLQQGHAVADIAMFIGEDIPARAVLPEDLPVPLPAGYGYDSINRDALMRLARVEDGALVLPGGAHYRILVLPRGDRMTPVLAARLAGFAAQGLTIVGDRPSVSPSAEAMARADAAVAKAVLGMRIVGFDEARDLDTLLSRHGVAADVVLPEAARGQVEWTHRSGSGWDLYFFSNQGDAATTFAVDVRAAGVPWLFHADSGMVERMAAWQSDGTRTVATLSLDAHGSTFLLVARGAIVDPVVSVDRPGGQARIVDGHDVLATTAAGNWIVTRRSGSRRVVTMAAPPPSVMIDGPWELTLGNSPARRWPVLGSWSASDDAAVRFFSGTGIYRTRIDLPRAAVDPTLRWLLDLGAVSDLAAVTLNGRVLTTLWKPPFQLDVTGAIRQGRNLLEIAVTNTWKNRLVGDAALPKTARSTAAYPLLHFGQPWLPVPGDTLLPAGLLGPVHLVAQRVLPL